MKQVSVNVPISKREAGFAAIIGLAKKYLADGSNAWNLSPQAIVMIVIIPFVVAFLGVVAALIGKDLYKWFTSEDGFAESLQVIFYSLAFAMSLVITYQQWQKGSKLIAALYLGLSFALFFLIGEELNWGQRIFKWGTSESFVAINKQGETNLHNIYGVGDTFKWVQLLVGAYGVLLPLIALRWAVPGQFREIAARVIPHYTLIPYFLLLFIWRIYRNFLEAPEEYYFAIAEYNEVMELVLSVGFFLFVGFQLRRDKAKRHS